MMGWWQVLDKEKVSDGRVLDLIRGWLKADTLKGLERWTPTRGSPQDDIPRTVHMWAPTPAGSHTPRRSLRFLCLTVLHEPTAPARVCGPERSFAPPHHPQRAPAGLV